MTLIQMYRRSLFIACCAMTVALAALAFAPTASAQTGSQDAGADKPTQQKRPQEVTYNGRLQDQKGAPISGIFQLKFDLYASKNASDANWSETRFVAVTNGDYRVPLGADKPLSKQLLDRSSFIGVTLVGEGEILRDRLRIRTPGQAGGDASNQKHQVSDETKQLLKQAKKNNDLPFANVAERALNADHADVADKVGSLTPEQIRELARSDDRAMEQLGKHIADPNAHSANLGGGVGDGKRVMREIGGSGGGDFNSSCPDGYVMTGIQGGAGSMIDRIAIVCSPLK
jgi:hypothetical protein